MAASRVLIEAQSKQIDTLKQSLLLEQQKSALLESINKAQAEQITNYKVVIVPAFEKERDVLLARNAKLEKSNKRLRKIGTVLGVAAGVMGYVIFH